MYQFRFVVMVMAMSLCLVAPAAVAQTQTLVAPGPTNNNYEGVMFDVSAANDVTITGFTMTQVVTGGTYRVYGRNSTFVGNSTSSAGWLLLGSGAMPTGANVPFPGTISLAIPAGQTGALYIISDAPSRIGYRNGTAVGNVISADANITLREGLGRGAPDFTGTTVQPRAFVGSVSYQPGLPNSIPTLSEWAMILLGLLLAGTAVVVVQRRMGQA